MNTLNLLAGDFFQKWQFWKPCFASVLLKLLIRNFVWLTETGIKLVHWTYTAEFSVSRFKRFLLRQIRSTSHWEFQTIEFLKSRWDLNVKQREDKENSHSKNQLVNVVWSSFQMKVQFLLFDSNSSDNASW